MGPSAVNLKHLFQEIESEFDSHLTKRDRMNDAEAMAQMAAYFGRGDIDPNGVFTHLFKRIYALERKVEALETKVAIQGQEVYLAGPTKTEEPHPATSSSFVLKV